MTGRAIRRRARSIHADGVAFALFAIVALATLATLFRFFQFVAWA